MNCTQSLDLLQERLDGLPLVDRTDLDRHIADCPECRQLHAAAARLEDGLRLLSPSVPPPGLTAKIVSRVAADRRRRLVLRRSAIVMAAASVLLAALLAYHPYSHEPGDSWMISKIKETWNSVFGLNDTPVAFTRIHSGPDTVVEFQPEEPSLTASVAEAGSAMVSLSKRAADETVGQTRLFIPEVIPAPPLMTSEPMQPIIEPPTESLRQAGNGMTAALDPVTSSARRAFSLFFREASTVVPAE